jgi:hypothetical protein
LYNTTFDEVVIKNIMAMVEGHVHMKSVALAHLHHTSSSSSADIDPSHGDAASKTATVQPHMLSLAAKWSPPAAAKERYDCYISCTKKIRRDSVVTTARSSCVHPQEAFIPQTVTAQQQQHLQGDSNASGASYHEDGNHNMILSNSERTLSLSEQLPAITPRIKGSSSRSLTNSPSTSKQMATSSFEVAVSMVKSIFNSKSAKILPC